MSTIVADCPRCEAAHTTFDVKDSVVVSVNYGWQHTFELACVCRACERFTTLVARQKKPDSSGNLVKDDFLRAYGNSINDLFEVRGYINLKDTAAVAPPEYLSDDLQKVFREGATSLAVECPNAAGAMFRTCIDMATRSLLPEGEIEGLSWKVRRDLGLRLPWLFKNGLLAKDLEPLSKCIREDGNDGAHAGTLLMEDAQDLLDFTEALLNRLFTEPARLKIAEARRDARRQKKEG